MKKTILTTAALTVVLASGCTSGLQDDVDALKTRVDVLEQEVAANKAAVANAAAAADSAQAAAQEAQATADRALEANAATNEKVDRMFQRSQSK